MSERWEKIKFDSLLQTPDSFPFPKGPKYKVGDAVMSLPMFHKHPLMHGYHGPLWLRPTCDRHKHDYPHKIWGKGGDLWSIPMVLCVEYYKDDFWYYICTSRYEVEHLLLNMICCMYAFKASWAQIWFLEDRHPFRLVKYIVLIACWARYACKRQWHWISQYCRGSNILPTVYSAVVHHTQIEIGKLSPRIWWSEF